MADHGSDTSVLLRRSRDGDQQAWGAAVAEAEARRMSGRVGQRFDSLKAIARAASLVDELQLGAERILQLRNTAIASMALTDVRVVEHWDAMARQVAATDADFEHYFQHVAAEPGAISVGQIDDLQERFRLPGFGLPAWILRPSRDGRFLAAKYHDRQKRELHLYVWDLHTRETVLKVKDGVYYDGMDFSPDGRSIVIGPRDGSVRRYDLTTGQPTQSLAPAPSGYPAYAIRFDPLGEKLAVSSLEQQTIEIRDPQSSEVLASYVCPSGIRGVHWNHDGRLLAAGCDDQHIYVWDTESPATEPRLTLAGHHSNVIDVAFNDRGDILASYSWDETTRLWSIGTGRKLLTIEGRIVRFSQGSTGVRPSPHGKWDLGGRFLQPTHARRLRTGRSDLAHRDRARRSFFWQPPQPTASGCGISVVGAKLRSFRSVILAPWCFIPRETGFLQATYRTDCSSGLIVSIPNPVKAPAQTPNEIKVGPPRKLLAARRCGRASFDRAGGKIVVAKSINTAAASAVVLNLEQRVEQNTRQETRRHGMRVIGTAMVDSIQRILSGNFSA